MLFSNRLKTYEFNDSFYYDDLVPIYEDDVIAFTLVTFEWDGIWIAVEYDKELSITHPYIFENDECPGDPTIEPEYLFDDDIKGIKI